MEEVDENLDAVLAVESEPLDANTFGLVDSEKFRSRFRRRPPVNRFPLFCLDDDVGHIYQDIAFGDVILNNDPHRLSALAA